MSDDDAKVKVGVYADFENMVQNLKSAGDHLREHTEQMGGMVGELAEKLGGLTSQVGGVTTAIGGLGPALAALAAGAIVLKGLEEGFHLVEKAVEDTLERSEQFLKTGFKVGGSIADLNDLYASIKLVGGSMSDVDALANGMTRALRSNEAQINANGIATRDANGQYLSTAAYLKNVTERANEMSTAADRNQLLQVALSRAGVQLGPVLNEISENMSRGTEMADKYGQVIGTEDIKAMQEFNRAKGELQYGLEVMESKIGREVIPILTEFGKILAENLPAAIMILKGAIEIVIEANIAMSKALERAEVYADVLKTTLGIGVVSAIEAVYEASQGRFAAALNTMRLGVDSVGIAWRAATSEIQSYDAAADQLAADMTAKLNSEGGEGELGPGGKGKFKGKGKKDGSEDQVKDWQDELNLIKAKLQESDGELAEMALEDEKKFWEGKLGQTKKYSDEWVKVMQLIGKDAQDVAKQEDAEEKQLDAEKKKAMDERIKMSNEEAAEKRRASMDNLNFQRENLQEEVNLGVRSKQDMLQEERGYLLKKMELDLQTLTDEQKLLKEGTVEYQKVQDQKLDVQRRTALQIQQLETKAAADTRAQWASAIRSVAQDFMMSVGQMLQGTATFTQAVQNLMRSLTQSLIKMFEDWVMKQIEQQLLAKLAGKSTAASQITANAGIYATAAMQSVAAIPVVGWAMAPGVGAAAEALGMGYLASIASAERGFDIPPGENPLTQLHEREMVLPAEFADPLREMLKGGGGNGDTHHHHYNINTMDARSMRDALRRNDTTMFRFAGEQARMFAGGGKR